MPRARRLAAVAAAVLFAAATPPSFGQTLRIAMTASDTPTTTGIPNNGGEGFRFCGFPAFDGLIDWDFTHPERIAGLTSPANGRSMTATTPAGSSTMAPM
jgi:peptide/nickel transport system substrate-binding protein